MDCKSYTNPMQIQCKSYTNPMQILYKPYANPIIFAQILYKSYANPIQILYKTVLCKRQVSTFFALIIRFLRQLYAGVG